ncbi:MAG: ABC transporter substrate-binding protein [Sphaerochaeta sp.]|uniref:ABC transporter substrate-binding protein n=1 Tax=Sphaerochaeta sp. TaxID=1972642 RepID=UPI002FC72C2D
MKKIVLLTVLALLSMGMVFATGAPEKAAAPAKPAVSYEVTEPITIEWWHALEQQYWPLVDEIVGDFNATHPLITVEAKYIGNYTTLNETLVAAHAAGTGLPALSAANTPYVAEYGKGGLTEDLTPYIKATGYDIDDFGQGLIEATSYEGKQVTVPFLISTQVMYYNKTMADKEGITIPAKIDDLDAFMKKASKIAADGTTTRWATIIPGWDQWYFETFFLNSGVKIINDDGVTTDLAGPISTDLTKKFQNWVKKGYTYWASGTSASSNMRQNFIDQKTFSVIHTSSLYNTYTNLVKDFEVGMAWLPAGATKKSEIGGSVLLIPAKNDQKTKNAAWVFLQYLIGKDVNMKWADGTGYIPTRNSVLTNEEGKAFLQRKPAFKAIFDNLDEINPRIQHPGWNQLATIWKSYLDQIMIEGQDVDTQLGYMADEINEVLADSE